MQPETWTNLSAEEKQGYRLASWAANEGKAFATADAAKTYAENTKRLVDILKLKKPDRVPRLLLVGDYIAQYGGVTPGDLFYDYGKAVQAMTRFHQDFDLDYTVLGNFFPGKLFDLLGYKLYRLPGSTLAPSQRSQSVEGEYMRADEYDALIANPDGFLMRTYAPRVVDALAGWQLLPSMLGTTELPFLPFMMVNFGIPPMQKTLRALADAAQAALEWLDANGQLRAVTLGQLGLPGTVGGFTKAPFDFLGDTLRGTHGIMLDLYRSPQKVLAAVERLVPLAIQMGVDAANSSGNPFALLPLHKGADGFMSNADFEKFYWPSLKATLLGLIKEGVIPFVFVEGGYNRRLDIIADSGLPAGKTIWLFDQTEMAEVKKKFGSWACIGGNVPASLFKVGSVERMESYIKKLFDTCAPGGGFFLAPGAVLDQARAENIHTYLRVAKEYGQY